MPQTTRYPATRYRSEPPPDLGARGERERLSAPALKAFFNIMARWKRARRGRPGAARRRQQRAVLRDEAQSRSHRSTPIG